MEAGEEGEEGSGKLDKSSDRVLSLCLVLSRSAVSLELMSCRSSEELLLLLLLACLWDDLRSMIAASARACSTVADVSAGACLSVLGADAPDEVLFVLATP